MKKLLPFFGHLLLLFCSYNTVFSGNPGPYVDLSAHIEDKSVAFKPGTAFSLKYSVYLAAYLKTYDSSTTVFYLSKDRQLDYTDFKVGQQPTKPLVPFTSIGHVVDLVIADSIPEGPYYLLVKADGLNSVYELDEYNNGTSVPAYVGEVDLDLSVEILDSTLTAYQFSPFQIRYKEKNTGTFSALPHTNAIYLSKDTIIDYKDHGLQEQLIPAYDGSIEFKLDATLWSQIAPGTYNLIVISDTRGDNIESNESNNRAIIPVTILAANIDITVKPTVNELTVVKQTAYTIPFRVFNHGNNAVHSVNNRFYISKDTLISSDDKGFSGLGNYTINAHDSTDGTETRNIFREELAAGDYYLLIETDYLDLLKETNEDNNISNFIKFKLLDKIVNVKTLKGNTPALINVGNSYETVFKVVNEGNLGLNPNLDLYFSKDSLYSSIDDILLASQSSTLAPGELKEFIVNFSTEVLAGQTSGKYYLLQIVNQNSSYLEDIWWDNNRAYSVTLTSPSVHADLKTSITFITESGLVPGSKQKIKTVIENASDANIGQSTSVAFFLSKDKVLNTNNAYALGNVQVPALKAYEKVNLEPIVDIPQTVLQGSYYVIAVADYTQALSETNEANNTATSAVKVVPATLDFAVFQPILSKTWGKPNDKVDVSVSFRNVTNTILNDLVNLSLVITDNLSLQGNVITLDNAILTTKANTHQTYQTSFAIPQQLAFKKYYVFALVSYQGFPLESNTQNNRAYAVLDVKATAARLAEEDQENGLSVAPNPTEGDIFIQLNGVDDIAQSDIVLTNTLGETVKNIASSQLSQGLRLNIEELPQGCYILQINHGQRVLTQKVYKQ